MRVLLSNNLNSGLCYCNNQCRLPCTRWFIRKPIDGNLYIFGRFENHVPRRCAPNIRSEELIEISHDEMMVYKLMDS